jgi:hypothetical protein
LFLVLLTETSLQVISGITERNLKGENKNTKFPNPPISMLKYKLYVAYGNNDCKFGTTPNQDATLKLGGRGSKKAAATNTSGRTKE